jgi:hypothetical protein
MLNGYHHHTPFNQTKTWNEQQTTNIIDHDILHVTNKIMTEEKPLPRKKKKNTAADKRESRIGRKKGEKNQNNQQNQSQTKSPSSNKKKRVKESKNNEEGSIEEEVIEEEIVEEEEEVEVLEILDGDYGNGEVIEEEVVIDGEGEEVVVNEEINNKTNKSSLLPDHTSNATKSDKMKLLESEVSKLNALTQVMMKRMNFYEQQLELLVTSSDNEKLKKLVQRKERLRVPNWKTTTNQTTIADLEEHYNLMSLWVDKLQNDRAYFQKRLSKTHVELKRCQQEQLKLQSRLFRKTQYPIQQQQQQTSNNDGEDDNMTNNSANNNNNNNQNKGNIVSSSSSIASSSLVDDMLDSWYTNHQLHKNPVPILQKNEKRNSGKMVSNKNSTTKYHKVEPKSKNPNYNKKNKASRKR